MNVNEDTPQRRQKLLRQWARTDWIQTMLRTQFVRTFYVDPPDPAAVRICGHCGTQIQAVSCTRCEWRDINLMHLLLCAPEDLPTCPYCFAKPFIMRTMVIGATTYHFSQAEVQDADVRTVPWCREDGTCSMCHRSAFQWQRDMIAVLIAERQEDQDHATTT